MTGSGLLTENRAAFRYETSTSLSVMTLVAFFVALARKRLTRRIFYRTLVDTASTTGMIYMMLIGANVLSYFVTASRLPEVTVAAIQQWSAPPLLILGVLLAIYIVLGAIFEEVSVMLITLPFVLPLVVGFGHSPVWWGIINVIVIEIGMIAPPIGLNVFVVQSLARDVPMKTIYKGIMPFFYALLATLAFVLWAHPSLVGLPCAALLLIAPANADQPGATRAPQPLAGLIGALSFGLLILTAVDGRLGAVMSAYIVLVTAAFASLLLLRPASMLKQSFRSILLGGLATAVLVQIVWGTDGWGAISWEVTRDASYSMRWLVKLSPPQWIDAMYATYEPMVRFVSLTWPGMLALQSLAGLALAWQLHLRLTSAALCDEPVLALHRAASRLVHQIVCLSKSRRRRGSECSYRRRPDSAPRCLRPRRARQRVRESPDC